MAAGRSAGDSDPVGINMIVGGMVANESHSAVHVRDNLGNRVPGLAAVDDREDGVASLEQFIDRHRVDCLMPREPTPADHPDDRRPVGIGLGREHVHGQRRAELPTVNDVFLAGEIGVGFHAGRQEDGREGQENEKMSDANSTHDLKPS